MEREEDMLEAQANLADVRDAQLEKIIENAFTKMFAAEDMSGHNRFVNVSRVPLICQSIIGINSRLEGVDNRLGGIESNIVWGVRVVIGAVLIGLVASLAK